MTDIATLGLAVNTEQVARARDELGRFVGSAKAAETAAKGFEQGAARVGTATEKMARQMQSAVNSAAAINQRLNVRDSFSPLGKAAELEQTFAQMDTLRAKFNPLFAAQQVYRRQLDEINHAVKIGALTEAERTAAMHTATLAYNHASTAIKQYATQTQTAGSRAALSSFAMTNLAFQLNDVATMAAMGADPLRILASQAGQFYQILATGEGGVRGSVSYLKDVIVGMITPLRVAAAGFGALGIAAGVALKSAVDNINAANTALAGIGRGSGLVAADINAIALAAAEAGDQTVGGARETALALAATGKISEDMIRQLVGLSRQFAKTFGEEGPEAAARMARAFADPTKGVDELNKRLGAFDDRTRQAILSLSAQNRSLDAQRLMIDGVRNSVVGTQESTSKLERTWRDLTAAMSEYWEKFGEGLRRATDGPTLEEQLENANKELEKLQRWSGRLFAPSASDVRAAMKQIEDLTSQLNALSAAKAEEAAQQKALNESNVIGDIARRTVPDYEQLRRATDEWLRLRDAIANNDVMNRLDGAAQVAALKAAELREQQVEWMQKAVEAGGIAVTQAREDHDITMRTISARSTAQRADIAYRQEILRLTREDPANAEERADMASREVVAQAAAQARRAAEQRIISADHAIEQAQRELGLVGQTAQTRSTELALLQAKQQLQQSALQAEGDRNAYDREHLQLLEARVREQAALNNLVQIESIKRDLAFEQAQMGRSSREQSVYSRMQGLGLLTDGQIVGGQAEMIAQQVRFNEVMRLSQEMSTEFATGFIRDMKNGVDATEALANALNRLADRFLDMAMDQAFSGMFAPFSQGVASGATGGSWAASITSGGGGLFGGSLIPGILHDGGVVGSGAYPKRAVPASLFAGAKRYHQGGVIGANEVPIIAEKGERVLTKAQQRAMGGVNITINTPIDASGADAAAIARLEAGMAQRDAMLPQQIVSTIRDATERRYI